jgi:hypothetical protein
MDTELHREPGAEIYLPRGGSSILCAQDNGTLYREIAASVSGSPRRKLLAVAMGLSFLLHGANRSFSTESVASGRRNSVTSFPAPLR